jgi:hypothetical protein
MTQTRLVLIAQQDVIHPVRMYLRGLTERGRLENRGLIEKAQSTPWMTHLARTESIYVWFPFMLERDVPAGSCCTAHPAPSRTTPDLAKDITITAEFLVLTRYIINNGVDPASEEFPTGTAILGNVIVVDTLPHGNIEVPSYDEAIAGARVENTFGGRAADELGGSVECEGRDTKAVTRFVFAWRVESRLGMLCRVGDHDGVD